MQNDDELRKKMIDIADEIELGMTIYVHKTSLEWISLPDMDNYFEIYEEDDWADDRAKLAADRVNYVEIPRVLPRRMYLTMQRFSDEIVTDLELKTQLNEALQVQAPFRYFKNAVYNSGAKYKNAWHRFRGELYFEWVREHFGLLLHVYLLDVIAEEED